jgi:hypothetical protein
MRQLTLMRPGPPFATWPRDPSARPTNGLAPHSPSQERLPCPKGYEFCSQQQTYP